MQFDQDKIIRTILANAAEIVRLHARAKETFKTRDHSAKDFEAWERACAEFHSQYDKLSFPIAGQGNVYERILSGDPEAMEVAICFLECRPYLFRSGYFRTMLLRKCKRAPLSLEQTNRLKAVMRRQEEWRKLKEARDLHSPTDRARN